MADQRTFIPPPPPTPKPPSVAPKTRPHSFAVRGESPPVPGKRTRERTFGTQNSECSGVFADIVSQGQGNNDNQSFDETTITMDSSPRASPSQLPTPSPEESVQTIEKRDSKGSKKGGGIFKRLKEKLRDRKSSRAVTSTTASVAPDSEVTSVSETTIASGSARTVGSAGGTASVRTEPSLNTSNRIDNYESIASKSSENVGSGGGPNKPASDHYFTPDNSLESLAK